jgi:fibronectin type 3 domain-containing protein
MRKIYGKAILFGLGAVFLGLLGGCFLFAPPPVPTGISASDGDYPDHILVSWNAARGAQRYEVLRAESEDGEYAKIGESTTTTFSDTEAQGNRLYWYRVRACNPFGCSALSEADSGYFLAPAPPLPPQNVQASDGTFSNRIRVTWSASVGASYYELYRSDVPGADFLRIAQLSTTSYDDQGIVLGRTYYYKVKACNSYGCSDFSETDAGFAAASAPGAPQNVQASDGTYSDRVRITWDPVPGASRYEVHRATSRDGTYELIGETTATTYDDTAVTVGTTYWYKVRAWNALGYGPFSDPDSGYASAAGGGGGGGGTQLPGQVRGVSASDGTYPDKIRITWNSVSGAKTYRVYRSETGVEGTFSQIAEVPSGTTSYDDTTVTDFVPRVLVRGERLERRGRRPPLRARFGLPRWHPGAGEDGQN